MANGATPEHFDAVIVGSGFGGSVAAFRLAEGGMRVCLLERGQPYPPGSFPRAPHAMKRNFWDPSQGLYGMYSLWWFRRIAALISSGLGGGSLIYANVLIRKDEEWFIREDLTQGGYESWPVTRQDLEPHYDRVEAMLGAQRYPFEHPPYRDTPKTRAMQIAGERLGLEWMLPKLAVTFGNPQELPIPGEPIAGGRSNLHGKARYTCRLCGECDIGCNYGSKNTLDFNYLTAAQSQGAGLRHLCEVTELAPDNGHGYRITYRKHSTDRRRDEKTPTVTVTADHLILSAGALGSTFLLLRNRDRFPALSKALGSRFCGNGDLLGFALRCRKEGDGGLSPWLMEGGFGPVITSALRGPDALDGPGEQGAATVGGAKRGFYIEDAGFPAFMAWMVDFADAPGLPGRIARFAWRGIRSGLGIGRRTEMSGELTALLGSSDFSSTSLPLLGMGRDVPDGNLFLRRDLLECDWRIRRSEAYFRSLRGTMQEIAGVWGGRFRDNLLWHIGRRLITVHPLGGCPMGRNAHEGVVDPFGEVFGYPAFYIADGSVMPGPIGPNPALTIAAVADRTADHILQGWRGAHYHRSANHEENAT